MDASLGPRMSLIIICLVNYSAVFYSLTLDLLLAMLSMFLSYLSRLDIKGNTSRGVTFSGSRLRNNIFTLFFEGLIDFSFVLGRFEQLRFLFDKLYSLFPPFGEGNLIVLDDECDHLGDKFEIGN